MLLVKPNIVLTADRFGSAVYGVGSAAARLLGLQVRIPPGNMDASLVCSAYCHVDFSASG